MQCPSFGTRCAKENSITSNGSRISLSSMAKCWLGQFGPARLSVTCAVVTLASLISCETRSGEWHYAGALAPETLLDDAVGQAIALDGGLAILGDWAADSRTGAAYLMDADPTSSQFGRQLHTLSHPTGEVNHLFGYSVDIANGVAIVGGKSSREIALVFDANPESATFGSVLTELHSNRPSMFTVGSPVATNGKIAVVSAGTTCFSCGAVVVYDIDQASPTFGQEVNFLTASNQHEQNNFGFAIDVHGKLAVVTAPGGPPHDYQGSVYLIDIDPASPSFGRELWRRSSPFGTAEGFFGYDAALGEKVAVVTDHGGETAGAHIFDADPASPTFGEHLLRIPAPIGPLHYGFGRSVSISGGVAAIGVRGNQGGAVYLYDVDPASAAFGQLKDILPLAGTSVVAHGEDVAIDGSVLLAGGYTSFPDGVALVYTTRPVPEPSIFTPAAGTLGSLVYLRRRFKWIRPKEDRLAKGVI